MKLRTSLLFAILCALSACETVQGGPDLLESETISVLSAQAEQPLPVIGQIETIYDGQPILWQTLDFSLGAIDPSANVISFEGVTSLFVGGHLPGQDFRENYGRLRIRAELPNGAVPGAASNVEIAVIDEPGFDGPRYRSGTEAVLQVTTITPPDLQITPYGPVAGTFIATLCRAETSDAPADPSDCKPIAGDFSTQASFEGLR